MKKLGILLLAFVISFFAGCSVDYGVSIVVKTDSQSDDEHKQDVSQTEITQENDENVYTFTDDLGREVTVSNPKRVAALLGSYADMWVLAGGTVQASADDAWEDFELTMPEDAVNLGKTKDISLEKLFESNPDFILASTNTRVHMEWKDTLEQSGIPTAYFDIADFDDYLRVLDICTDITGRKDLYEQNGLKVQEQIDQAIEKSEARVKSEGETKVLIVRVSASMIVAKNSQDNVLGEMLKSLGCDNIADSKDSLLENLSLEYILQEDPDKIFVIQIGDADTASAHFETFIKENPAWQTLTAVKEGHVYLMDKKLYNLKPNDRWGEAYEKLENILSENE